MGAFGVQKLYDNKEKNLNCLIWMIHAILPLNPEERASLFQIWQVRNIILYG